MTWRTWFPAMLRLRLPCWAWAAWSCCSGRVPLLPVCTVCLILLRWVVQRCQGRILGRVCLSRWAVAGVRGLPPAAVAAVKEPCPPPKPPNVKQDYDLSRRRALSTVRATKKTCTVAWPLSPFISIAHPRGILQPGRRCDL